jgi:hypothetical protein
MPSAHAFGLISAVLKGLGHEIEFKKLDRKLVMALNKNLYWFLNFQNALLMRCRHCHFPCGLGENIWEKQHVLETSPKFLCGNRRFLLVHLMNL